MTIFLGIFLFLIGLTLLHKYRLLGTFLKMTGICAAIVTALGVLCILFLWALSGC